MPLTGPPCSALFAHLPDGVFLIDPESSSILQCNDAALTQLGMQRDEVLNQSVLSLQANVVGMDQWASMAQAVRSADSYVFMATWSSNIHPEDAPREHLIMQEHLEDRRERFEAEYRLHNRNGHYLWLHDRGRVCDRDAQGKPTRLVGMVQNITDQKITELALQKLALHDPLTGLPNRRECDQVLSQRLEVCRRLNVPLGMCFFDLDHFKRVNDTFGHAVGDQVLLRIARTIRQEIRSSDDLFRWGGEEFLLLCTNTPLHDLLVLVDKLRQKLASIDWQDLAPLPPITGSFGVAVFPDHAKDAPTLFLAADTATYRAKAHGRDRVERAAAVPSD